MVEYTGYPCNLSRSSSIRCSVNMRFTVILIRFETHVPSSIHFSGQHRVITKRAAGLPDFIFLGNSSTCASISSSKCAGLFPRRMKLGGTPGKHALRCVGRAAGWSPAGSSLLLSISPNSCCRSSHFRCLLGVGWSECPTMAALVQPEWPSSGVSSPFQAALLCCFGATSPFLS